MKTLLKTGHITLTCIGLLIVLNLQKANAQSLGDPVVSITFGAGTATHAGAFPADSGSTSYTYSSADFPRDGSYTIENTTAGSGNVWWSTTDHTGNAGGYMMVVNASVSKTDYFYKRTISGLCSGTTYQFSAYLLNLLRDRDISPPNITFSIEYPDGTPIKQYTTGDIAKASSPTWIYKAFNFSLPANVGDVVIKMINNSAGGAPANDLAIDDIIFRPYGPDITASFSSTSAKTAATACTDNPASYTITTTVPAGYNVLWQYQNASGVWTNFTGANSTAASFSFISPTIAGTYHYRVVTAQSGNINSSLCRSASNTLTLTVGAAPVAAATANTPVCAGTTLYLSASAGSSYKWTGPNRFTSILQNPVIDNVTTAAAGTYQVTILSAAGCDVTANVQVVVNAQPVASAGVGTTICEGESTTLSASGGTAFSWLPVAGLSNPNIANPVASPTDTTTYQVTVSNGTCTSTASVTVNVLKKSVANAGADKHITQGQSITLNGSAKGSNVSYYWTPADGLSNSTILNPVASPPDDITYTLHVVSNSGCGTEATDDVFVRVYKKVTIYNTFSPNSDGKNDTWDIEALNTYPESVTQVFNRYGAIVFKSTGYAKAWDGRYDGRDVPSGTYYYMIDLKNGNILKGWVLVIR